jgi:DNA-binding response OmpR family regulator
MVKVVVAGQNRQKFKAVEKTLKQHPMEIVWAPTGMEALNLVSDARDRGKAVDLLITDETLADMTGRDLVGQVIMKSPVTNCAAVSTLSSDQFHEAYEGLGVLMQLPLEPDAESGKKLVSVMKKLNILKP